MREKKNKGFTLIELLSVIVILSIIALISIPIVYKSIQFSREQSYLVQVKHIEEQVKKWTQANAIELPNIDNDVVFITISDLKQSGYLKEEDVIDPRNNNEMNGCVAILYEQNNNQYKYTYNEKDCNTLKSEDYKPIFSISGVDNLDDLHDTAEVNAKYIYPVITATDYNGRELEVMGPLITEKGNNITLEDVDTSVLDKEYELVYTTYDPRKDISNTVTITVTVVDTTPPVITVDGNTSDFSIIVEAGESFTVPSASVKDNSNLDPILDVSGSVNVRVPADYKITYTATDSKGNVQTLILTVTVVDTLLPNVRILGNPTSWTNQSVVLEVEASDSGSGLAENAYSFDGGTTWTNQTQFTVDENTTLDIWVRDKVENITKKTVVVDKIDKTVPDVSFTVASGTFGTNSWYISNVELTLTPVAGASGIKEYSYCSTTGTTCTPNVTVNGPSSTTLTLTTESATNKVCVVVSSMSGSSNSRCSSNYKIDKTNPTISSVTGNPTTWYNKDVILTVNASDAESKLHETAYSFDNGSSWQVENTKTFTSNQTVNIKVKDNAGRTSEQTIVIDKIDKIPPTIKIDGCESSGNCTIQMEATKETYKIPSATVSDNASITAEPTITGSVTASIAGTYQVTYTVADTAGNTAVAVLTVVVVDTTKPNLTYEMTPSQPNGDNGWYTSFVTFEVNATDVQNIKTLQYALSTDNGNSYGNWINITTNTFVVSTEGDKLKVKMRAIDDFDNEMLVTTGAFKIDTVAPTLPVMSAKSGSSTGSNYTASTWTNQDVVVILTSSDDTSGIARYEWYENDDWTTRELITESNQGTITYTVEGDRTTKYRVVDSAGNRSNETATFNFKIDKSGPDITSLEASTDWGQTNIITAKAIDSLSGIVGYAFSNNSTLPSTFNDVENSTSTQTFTYEVNQNGTYYFFVKDAVGNVSSKSVNVSMADKTGPTISSITGNPTSWTKDDVTLTISASDAELGLHATAYSFDNGSTWQVSNSKVFKTNQTVNIAVRDAVGNITTTQVVINKIDRTAPNITSLTVPDVWRRVNTITAKVIDSQSGLVGYAWSTSSDIPSSFTSVVGMTSEQTYVYDAEANGTYYFFAKDGVGNISSKSVEVTKVDRTAPTISSVTGNPTSWTKSDVTLTINASDSQSGLHATAYSFDDGNSWQSGNTKTFTSNQTVKIKVRDAVGNESTTTVNINRIDKVNPSINTLMASDSWGKTNTITATAIDTLSGIVGYAFSTTNSIPNTFTEVDAVTTEQTYTYTATANGTYYFFVKDGVGNTSSKSVEVTKVDRTAPTISSVTGNPTDWTNKDVVLTISASDSQSGLHSQAYSFDNGSSWQSDNTKTFTSNQTVNIKVRDAVGNESSTTVVINKLDKSVPVINSLTASTSWATTNTVTAKVIDTLSGIVGYAFSTSSETPSTFTSVTNTTSEQTYTYVSNENTTVYFFVKDAAGNVAKNNVVVNRVDKTGPTITLEASTSWARTNTITARVTDSQSGLVGYAWSTSDQIPSTFTNISATTSLQIYTYEVDENGTYYFFAKDAVGNVSSKSVEITKVDITAPTISSLTASTEWGQTNTITAKTKDLQSGLVGYAFSTDSAIPSSFIGVVNTTSEQTYTYTATENGTYYFFARDAVGNVSSKSVSVTKVDTTAPTITSITGNPSNWTNQDVTLTVNASDSQSGLHATAYSFDNGSSWQAENTKTFTSNQTVNIKVRDAVGNISETNPVVIDKIDKVAPTIKIDACPEAGSCTIEIEATTNPYTIPSATASDNASVTQTPTKSGSVIASVEGTYQVTYTVEDTAGNTGTAVLTVVVLDTTKPTLTYEMNPDQPNGYSDWYLCAVTFDVEATDVQGIASLQYALSTDNGNSYGSWVNITNNQFTISTNGSTLKVKMRAIDGAGNKVEVTTGTFKIDTVAPSKPTFTAKLGSSTGSAYTAGTWTNQNIVVVLNASDTLSGIRFFQWYENNAWTTRDLDTPSSTSQGTITYTADGDRTTKYRVVDVAGNASSETETFNFKIDKSAPTISSIEVTSSWATSNTITAKVTDSLSGLVGYAWSTSSTTPSSFTSVTNTTSEQTYTYEATANGTYYFFAKDAVGNVSSKDIMVGNVDTTGPSITLSASTAWGKANTVTANVIDSQSGLVGYAWSTSSTTPSSFTSVTKTTSQQTYTYEATANGTVYFFAKDALGNVSSKNVSVSKVDRTGPTVNVSGNPSNWTTSDVTLTVSASDSGVGLHETAYSFDDGVTWSTTTSKTYSSNQTVIIKVRDALENISTRTIVINKIDKEAPTITLTASADWATSNTITAKVKDTQSGLVGYAWSTSSTTPSSFVSVTTTTSEQTYTYTANANGTYYFFAKDNLGNISSKPVTVSKVDKTPPTIESVTGNPSAWGKAEVTLTVNASDSESGLHSVAYSFDDGVTWQNGNSAIFTTNQTVKIKVRDVVGNTSSTTVTINRIDTTAPTISSLTAPTSWGKTNIVTAKVKDTQSGLVGYAWSTSSTTPSSFTSVTTTTSEQTYTYTATANGTVYFFAKDAVGNVSSKSVSVTKVDTTAPTISEVTGNPTSWTSLNVTLTVSASDSQSGLHATAYSFDNGSTWQSGNTKTFTSNQTVNIKVRDAVGNVSAVKQVVINKIDKVAPTITLSGTTNSGTWTTGNNTLTATVSPTSTSSGYTYSWYQVPEYKYTSSGFTITEKQDSNGSKYWNATYSKTSGTENQWISMQFPTYQYEVGKTYKIHFKVRVNNISNMSFAVRHSAIGNDNGSDLVSQGFSSTSGWTEYTLTRVFKSSYTVGGTTYTTMSPRIEIYTSNLALTGTVTSRSVDFDFKDFWVEEITPGSLSTVANNLAVKLTDTGTTKSFTTDINAYYVAQVTTGAGVSATSNKYQVSIDKTNPTVNILGNPTSWTNQSVTIAVNASDSGSGLATNPYSFDGGSTWGSGNTIIVDSNQTLNIWVKDKVGNTTKKAVVVDKIDKTVPDVTFTVTSGTMGSNYWYTSNVDVQIKPTAGSSGVSSYKYCVDTKSCTPGTSVSGSTATTVTLSTESATNQICVAVTSVSGQTNTKCSGNYKIDKTTPTAPVLTGGSSTWTNANKTISIQTAGTAGVSNIKEYQYRVQNYLFGGSASMPYSLSSSFTRSGTVFTTTGTDPYISFTGLGSASVTGVEVYLNSALTSSLSFQVFYAAAGSSYSEANSVKKTVSSGATSFSVDLPDGTYDSLKFDFGGTSGVSFDVKYILYLEDGTTTSTKTVSNSGDNLVYYKTVSNSGLTSGWSSSQKVLLDKIVPTCGSWSGGSTTWTKNNRTLSIGCSDKGGSGCVQSSYSVTYSTTTKTATPSTTLKDNAGNTTTCTASSAQNVYVDKSNPVVNSFTAPTTWGKTNTITAKVIDAHSGLVGYAFSTSSTTPSSFTSVTNTTEEQTYTYSATANGTYYFFAKDAVGNVVSQSVSVSKVDSTGPTISSVTGNATSWTKSDVTLTVSASDAESELHATAYSFDNGSNWQTSNAKTFTSNQTVNIQVRDVVGNISSTSVTISKIDKTVPTISSLTASTTWATSNTITAKVKDAQSGLVGYAWSTSSTTPSSFTSVTNTTSEQTYTYTATANGTYYFFAKDAVGNVSSTSVSVTKVDRTAPTISSVTASTTWGKTNTIAAKVKDTQSGLVGYAFSSSSATPSSFTSVTNTTAEKTFTYIVSANGTYYFFAKDSVGNVSRQSVVVDHVIVPTASITAYDNSKGYTTCTDVQCALDELYSIFK